MKNTTLKIVFTTIGIALASVTTLVKAQTQTPSNQIQTVEVSPNDGFQSLRTTLYDRFDFTAAEYREGKIQSELSFEVLPSGALDLVEGKSECPEVRRELLSILKEVNFTLDPSSIKNHQKETVYSMPITLLISNR